MKPKTLTSVLSLSFAAPSLNRLLTFAVLAGSLGFQNHAKAERTQTAVVAAPVLSSSVSGSIRQRFEHSFQRALKRADVIASAVAANCHGEACWRQQAEAKQAALVVSYCADTEDGPGLCDPRRSASAAVEAEPQEALDLPHNYRFAAMVYSPLTGLVTSASAGCSSCSATEAADRLQGLTETMITRAKTADGIGQLSLQGLPSGTLVFADGVLRQTTTGGPIVLNLQADAPHVFDIYPIGHAAVHSRNVRVTAGEVSTVEVPLSPSANPGETVERGDDDAPESPSAPAAGYGYHTSPPAWRWALPLVLIGAGGLLLGLGGRAFALRGTCADQAGCPMTYNTEQVGMGLLGAGGALVGIGGITLAFGVQKVYVRVPSSSGD